MIEYRVFYLGRGSPAQPSLVNEDLLLLIIQKITGKNVKLTNDMHEADLVLAYPYVTSSILFKLKWVLSTLARNLRLVKVDAINLRWLLGIKSKKALFISHENLDRPYWWNMIGRFLINSDLPRLTFWPNEIDPRGARFPYWYNYIDWPNYPRKDCYSRFGRFYTLSELSSPLSTSSNRLDRAIAITSHLEHPRSALLQSLQSQFQFDIFGSAGSKLEGSKLDKMRQYKYAFCPENSTGFGYETEKIPEAWAAGCVPVGIFLNPYSQFNPRLINIEPRNPESYRDIKLLDQVPSLDEIENYVRKII